MGRDDELEPVFSFAFIDESRHIDCQLDEVVLIQRADRIVDKDIFKIIELVCLAIINLADVTRLNDLIQEAIKNTPNEIAFFTF